MLCEEILDSRGSASAVASSDREKTETQVELENGPPLSRQRTRLRWFAQLIDCGLGLRLHTPRSWKKQAVETCAKS